MIHRSSVSKAGRASPRFQQARRLPAKAMGARPLPSRAVGKQLSSPRSPRKEPLFGATGTRPKQRAQQRRPTQRPPREQHSAKQWGRAASSLNSKPAEPQGLFLSERGAAGMRSAKPRRQGGSRVSSKRAHVKWAWQAEHQV